MKRLELRDRQQWAADWMLSAGSSYATLAALDVLADGGNAVDAAVTASAMLTVALPMACGPGGDAAAVITIPGMASPIAATSLGRAPAGATCAAFDSRGMRTIPRAGPLSATSPALIDAWYGVHERWGTMPLGRVLEPAIAAAEGGIVVSGQFARWTAENIDVLDQDFAEIYQPAAGREAIGSVLRQPGLATLYRQIASSRDPERFRAELGRRLDCFSRSHRGLLDAADCSDHFRAGQAPQVQVSGWLVSTTPAPTQGSLLLQSLVLYEQLAGDAAIGSATGIHLLSEIINQAYGWRLKYLTDPAFHRVPDPLTPDFLHELGQAVDPLKRSQSACAGYYSEGDTSHFAIVDKFGYGISWIQSLGLGFGAGCGIPEWGLLLCNRLGRSATLNPAHINRCEPTKRPVNTIFPWTVSDGSGVTFFGGSPGGDSQVQWNAQTLAAMLVDGLDPLHSLSLPRWTSIPGSDKVEHNFPPQLLVDETMSETVISHLADRGHDVRRKASVGGVSRLVARSGSYCYGLDDGRQEGLTAGR